MQRQTRTSSSVQDSSIEWKVCGANSLSRDLRGPELMVNLSEQHMDGNYQLVGEFGFETNLSPSELKRGAEIAWWATRQALPEVAIELLGPQGSASTAYFHGLNTVEEAQEWISNTLRVVDDGTTLAEVRSRCLQAPLPSRGKQTMLHLVLDADHERHGIVVHTSHVLTGHRIFDLVDAALGQLVKDDLYTGRGLEDLFRPEQVSQIAGRLPQSTAHAYHAKFKASEREQQSVIKVQENALARFAKRTVGPEVHPEWKTRPSRVHNLVYVLDPSTTRNLLNGIKRAGVTLTTALFASITLATAQLHSKGGEEGAHLLFSAHARRFLGAKAQGGAPIGMAILPGAAWIDAEDLHSGNLEHLARCIAREQEQDISSPHLIPFLDNAAKGYQPAVQPAISRPTLTSQGFLAIQPEHQSERTWVQTTNAHIYGRHTDPSICFAAIQYRGRLRITVMLDERYFYPEIARQLASRALQLLSQFEKPGAEVESKL